MSSKRSKGKKKRLRHKGHHKGKSGHVESRSEREKKVKNPDNRRHLTENYMNDEPIPDNQLKVEKKGHSRELVRAFAMTRVLLTFIGQMPFTIIAEKDGTYSFSFKCRPITIFYLIMVLIMLAIFVHFLIGLVLIIGGLLPTKHTIRVVRIVAGRRVVLRENWETATIRKELLYIFIFFTWFCVAFAGVFGIVFSGSRYVYTMNFLNRMVQVIDADATEGIAVFILVQILLTFLAVAVLIVLFILRIKGVTELCAIIIHIFLRVYGLEIAANRKRKNLASIGGLILICIIFISSRINIIQFLFFARLLKNACNTWNHRLRNLFYGVNINKEDEETFKDLFKPKFVIQTTHRLRYKQMLKDHLLLVQAFKMIEMVFAVILITFYFFQVMSITLEIYDLISLGGFFDDENYRVNRSFSEQKGNSSRNSSRNVLDEDSQSEKISKAVRTGSLLLLGAYITYVTTREAHKAFEEASRGFEVVRRYGLLDCRNARERNFVLSLVLSFSRANPMTINAGGYFVVNNLLLTGIIATILGYLVTVCQIRPGKTQHID